mmetsp:Transcript_11046/g.18471  ORF Transcript_11046/g.18471 Transcript_11046/m.18471 type:complete len:159 (-) Transcript_11046:697-1173(-)
MLATLSVYLATKIDNVIVPHDFFHRLYHENKDQVKVLVLKQKQERPSGRQSSNLDQGADMCNDKRNSSQIEESVELNGGVNGEKEGVKLTAMQKLKLKLAKKNQNGGLKPKVTQALTSDGNSSTLKPYEEVQEELEIRFIDLELRVLSVIQFDFDYDF